MADIGLIGLAVMGQVYPCSLVLAHAAQEQLMELPYTSSAVIWLRRTLH